MLVGQDLELSKMALAPRSSGLVGFYASECGSKQAGRTKADMAVSFSLGVQHLILAQGYNLPH
jgi:hypothetical protein